jgi:effector-binding domain-containing protein
MNYSVEVVEVEASQIASVRAHSDRSRLPSLIVSSLDQVYAFLGTAPELVRGQNVVIYDGRWNIEAGVQVVGSFEGDGNVLRSATPGGLVATTLHRGPYGEIGHANEAILAWCREHGEELTGLSWEVYGDWAENESDLTTEVFYQLG